jgi:Zn-dependent peptidase ImmA (M78 family)
MATKSFSRNPSFIFLNIIKNNVDGILEENEDKCFSENPFVDIYAIAYRIGITAIIPVPAEKINYKHALLKGSVIFLNMDDSAEEQRFSIAHEIAHFYLMKTKKFAFFQYVATSKEGIPTKARLLIDHQLETIEKHNVNDIVTDKSLENVYEAMARATSYIMGKNVSVKTAHAVYDKVLEAYSLILQKTIDDKVKDIIYKALAETVEEEIADYFAANLIVPTERFLLWEDKTDKEIAQVFGVNENCIKKRREEEIEGELKYLAPKELSSGMKVKSKPPLSLNELKNFLEGRSIHDSKQD